MGWEISVLDYIQANLRADWLTPIMKVFTVLGDNGYIWIAMILALLCFKKTRKLGLMAAGALILEALACNVIIKPLVGRIRPYEVGQAIMLVAKPTDASFPSGHTGSAFAVITALFMNKSRLRWPSLVVGCIIAWSRLYFYIHYPTDILGGIVIGVITGIAGVLLVRYLLGKREQRLNAGEAH